MSKSYTRDHLKVSIAKILQTIGWNSINTTPLEILTDILTNFLTQVTRTTSSYANEFGCTEPNLDHLGLAFRDMGINISELEEYVKYVNFGPPPSLVPKYPIPKEDHLNFLKPGSKEVVTRPVHIHEHLPPMNPLLEENKTDTETVNTKTEEPEDNNSENAQVFKKPADLSPEFKRVNFRREEEGSRPTREISSVMMTTSGFLSPAREGRLPEARTPVPAIDPVSPATPQTETIDLNKKSNKVVKKVEKRKLKPDKSVEQLLLEEKKKRLNSMKWVLKSKQQQQQINKLPNKIPQDLNILPVQQNKMAEFNEVDKALEKLNTTITPVTVKQIPPQKIQDSVENIDKLFTEPDKKKVNIFKKISNVKNEKVDVKASRKDDIKQESRETSPNLIIDEPDEIVSKFRHISGDVTIEPISSVPQKSSEKMDSTPYFDDDSQPGIHTTPKTPEMITHSPPITKEKRKQRRESKKIKKTQKKISPPRLDNDAMDIDMERPKTPEAQGLPKMPPIPSLESMPFPFSFGGPGLIPAPLPLSNSMFPPLAFPPAMNLNHFAKKSFMPPINLKPTKTEPPPPSSSSSFNRMEEPQINNNVEKPTMNDLDSTESSLKPEKKNKEHKKDKKDKLKKRNKKDKVKDKSEKRKLKEEKKEKIRKEKKEKRKEKEKESSTEPFKITVKLAPSPRPETPEPRKVTIKPVVKKEHESEIPRDDEDRGKRDTSPGLAKISALVFGPPKPKPIVPPPVPQPTLNDSFPSSSSDIFVNQTKKTMLKPIPKIRTKEIRREPAVEVPTAPSSKFIDADGNEVWFCPACGRQDDGSPMIGCDGCDAWYHWVCVGIQVPPDDNEDWYCRHCLLRKNEDLQSDKQKKKRKKREKKEH